MSLSSQTLVLGPARVRKLRVDLVAGERWWLSATLDPGFSWPVGTQIRLVFGNGDVWAADVDVTALTVLFDEPAAAVAARTDGEQVELRGDYQLPDQLWASGRVRLLTP